ncbi:MAG: Sua5 YciO YrdC YwlC family protein [Nitrospira sp.]|nr:MAG: Sua5 YciO YrdC YwlC family protein [Nitrospira sp.]
MAVIESYFAADSGVLFPRIARLVQAGGVLAIPTETYYGLGANPFDGAAVARLLSIKGRPDGKPILILIGDRAQLQDLVTEVSPAAQVLMEVFWPGPLTLVFVSSARLPLSITSGTGTVGVRHTSHTALAELLRHAGPLTGTSANRSGEPPVQTAAEVDRTIGALVDVIVDGGPTQGGLPSTVVSVCDGVQMIREGPIDRAMIQQALVARGFRLKL